MRLDVMSTKLGRRLSAGMILRRWLREPLLHFLLIGSLLFAIYAVWGKSDQPGSKRIELSADDLRQLQIGFAAQWERQPTAEELAGLVESRVREEILYREALAMGLDKETALSSAAWRRRCSSWLRMLPPLTSPRPMN